MKNLSHIILSILWIALVDARLKAKEKMKAVVINTFGQADVLHLQEFPIPKVLENQVLVKVKAAGINPVDTYIRQGTYAVKPTLPAVLGKEVAGIIEDVHPTVTTFKKGDRVFCSANGGYAEFAACSASQCYHLPERLSFSQGAAIYLSYFTAYRAIVLKGNLKAGKLVLIHGASGGVGTAAIQIAKALGAHVVGSVGSSDGELAVVEAGADNVAYHKENNSLETILNELMKPGFNLIMENLANVNLQRDLEHLAENGRIVVVGNRGTININPRNLMSVEGAIYGVNLFKMTEEEQNKTAEFVLNGIKAGWLSPIVAREYTLDEASTAHYDIIHNIGARGKLVFKV